VCSQASVCSQARLEAGEKEYLLAEVRALSSRVDAMEAEIVRLAGRQAETLSP
jgi:hypothetical protein